MRQRPLLFALLSLLVLAAYAAADEEPASTPAPGVEGVSPLGETFIVPMENAPYPHSSREEGFTNSSGKHWPKDPHYTDSSVGFFVPAGFRAGERVDLLFYFHGHGNSVRESFETMHLREMVAASGRNVIFVFPEGPKNAGDSGGGKLEDPGVFALLVDEVMAELDKRGIAPGAKPGRILLSGHSGAYRVISYILEHGGMEANIEEVYLLDASYARTEQYSAWAARNSGARFVSIFTNHLAARNVEIMTQLTKSGTEYAVVAHPDLSEQILLENRVLFVHTQDLDHNGTVGTLETWLSSSRLDPIAAE
ncbi:MAG: hypothetical protein PWP23_1002 [Candidatus Sumerlaeota bacterium]|nr:hypothetical protein [Candidatus Sumerlaeota bacterium]